MNPSVYSVCSVVIKKGTKKFKELYIIKIQTLLK